MKFLTFLKSFFSSKASPPATHGPEGRIFPIGKHQLLVPLDHGLAHFQTEWPTYDKALGIVAKCVFSKYPDSSAIDIGANIGDSAALIQKHVTVPTLCIEGDPQFFSYLHHNAKVIGGVVVEEVLVGSDETFIDTSKAQAYKGSTSFANAMTTDAGSQRTRALTTILLDHSKFAAAKLVKIDTDGFDYTIMLASISFFKSKKPVIFYEHVINHGPDDFEKSIKAYEALCEAGYVRFVYYDNYGRFMNVVKNNERDSYVNFNTYLMSNYRMGPAPLIYYYDVCAFHSEDLDVFDALRDIHLAYNYD